MSARTFLRGAAAMLVAGVAALLLGLWLAHLVPVHPLRARPPLVKPTTTEPDLHPNPFQQPGRFEHPEMRAIIIYIDGTPRCVLIHDYDWKRVNGKLVWDGMPWVHYCIGMPVEWERDSA
jgi:hypothetical protein